ncbi:MAG: GntR family transcriptional regulator [Proteobacteria bacterium]|nr:GntR family transcriptional regulator [Pseudomonadota bacterium]
MTLLETSSDTPEAGRTGLRRPADSVLRAYAAIRALVVEFRLKPGERVNEFQLARQLGLSRTPVREALNRLASEGFLDLTPNRGFFFRPLDIAALVHFYELRGVLERGAFVLACQRASDEAIEELATYWDKVLAQYGKAEPDWRLDVDEEFHRRLAGLSGNPEFVRQIEAIDARIRFARRTEIAHSPRVVHMLPDHARIIALLRARAADAGGALLVEHISLSVEEAGMVLAEALVGLHQEPAG